MTETARPLPPFLADVVRYVQRRRVQVGIGDLHDLRLAVGAGFGLASSEELCELCVALWASSTEDATIIRAAFASGASTPEWTTLPPDTDSEGPGPSETADGEDEDDDGFGLGGAPATAGAIRLGIRGGPPPSGESDPRLVLIPQYPLAAREVAQAWRRLRRPVRSGPPAELDLAATIRERARSGVVTAPVVVPRRRNTMRLLLLLDRNGSMSPYNGYVDFVVATTQGAGRVDEVSVAYFHDVPVAPDSWKQAASVLAEDPFRLDVNPVVDLIGPLQSGLVYGDPQLTRPLALADLLEQVTPATGVLVISDAGAARRKFDAFRLVDTVALLKAVGTGASGAGSSGVAWLNPTPEAWWPHTTAAAIAQYVPMYPFTKRGLDQAVDTLRGRPTSVARLL